MANRQIPQEDLDRAEMMLSDGLPLSEVARETGITEQTLRRRFKASQPATGGKPKSTRGRRPDPPPRVPPKSAGEKPGDAALLKFLTAAAKAPAVPMQLFVHCDFCTQHFLDTGPAAARELLDLSEQDPALREMIEWTYGQWRKLAVGGILLTWAGLPVAHHLAPAGPYNAFAPAMGLPPRDNRPAHDHRVNGRPMPPASPTQPSADPVEDLPPELAAMIVGTPLEGMSTMDLLAMAQTLGVGVPFDVKGGDDGTTVHAPAETEISAATAADADPDPELPAA